MQNQLICVFGTNLITEDYMSICHPKDSQQAIKKWDIRAEHS